MCLDDSVALRDSFVTACWWSPFLNIHTHTHRHRQPANIKNVLTFLTMDLAKKKHTAKLPLYSNMTTYQNTATLEIAWWGWTFYFVMWFGFLLLMVLLALLALLPYTLYAANYRAHFFCTQNVTMKLSFSLSMVFHIFYATGNGFVFSFWLFPSTLQNLISYIIILLIAAKWA